LFEGISCLTQLEEIELNIATPIMFDFNENCFNDYLKSALPRNLKVLKLSSEIFYGYIYQIF
jgi:hypothetical protein